MPSPSSLKKVLKKSKKSAASDGSPEKSETPAAAEDTHDIPTPATDVTTPSNDAPLPSTQASGRQGSVMGPPTSIPDRSITSSSASRPQTASASSQSATGSTLGVWQNGPPSHIDAPREAPARGSIPRSNSNPAVPRTEQSNSSRPSLVGIGSDYSRTSSLRWGGPPDKYPLSPEFQYREYKFFKPGLVFRTPWYEPYPRPSDEQREDAASVMTLQSIARLDDPFEGPLRDHYLKGKYQWFIVINQYRTFCEAVAVNTYNGRGVVHLRKYKCDHAILHHHRKDAEALPAETQLGPREYGLRPHSIRMTTVRGHLVQKTARINFMQSANIHYDYSPVDKVGEVITEDIEHLNEQRLAVLRNDLTRYTPSFGGATMDPRHWSS